MPEKFWPERDSNPDLRDAGAVLHQLSYQANWKLIVMWVDDNLVDDSYMKRSLKCDLQRFFMTKKMTMWGGVHLSLELISTCFTKFLSV